MNLFLEPFELTNTARSTHDSVVFEKVKMVFQASAEILKKSEQLDELFSKPLFKPSLSPALSYSSLGGK